MKPLKSDIEDLDYLSQLGYDLVPGAESDVKKIKSAIKSKSLSSGSTALFAGICMLCAAYLAITIFFPLFYFKSTVLKPIIEDAQELKLLDQNMPNTKAPDAVYIQAELFEKPEIKKSVAANHENGLTKEDTAYFEIESKTAIALPIPNQKELRIKANINTPIRYIYNLKVSNYVLYYFKEPGKKNPGADLPQQDPAPMGMKDHAEEWVHEKFEEGVLFFKKQMYPEALFVFKEVETYNDEDVNCAFYSGMSHYYLNHFNAALPFFEIGITASNNAFADESKYYKACCLMALQKNAEARKLFESIVDEDGFYSAKAAQKLSELKDN